MNAQARKPGRAATIGNGVIREQGDPDVAEQVSAAEAEARTADHQVQVALAAYFIAEKRGFDPGHELEDWLAAEAQCAAAEQPSVTKPIQPVRAESMS
jgi:hypothetical protein